jgi:hypothetical protein
MYIKDGLTASLDALKGWPNHQRSLAAPTFPNYFYLFICYHNLDNSFQTNNSDKMHGTCYSIQSDLTHKVLHRVHIKVYVN